MENHNYQADYKALMNKMAKNTAVEALQISIKYVDEEKIILLMPITNFVRQPAGLLHGGMTMALAESAASMHATWGIDIDKKIPVGIEINGSHLNSASSGIVRAEAVVLRRSKSLIVHQINVYHNETNILLSTARVTNYYKQLK